MPLTLREAIEEYIATAPAFAKSRYVRRYDMYENSSREEFIRGLEQDIQGVLNVADKHGGLRG